MEEPRLSLLHEPLIRVRDHKGNLQRLSLTELFVALSRDEVRDYPALRPHQRHPWHALLVQLAAIGMHEANAATPWEETTEWCSALLALTPEQPDGSAYSLLAPQDCPAFLQAPVPEGRIDGWKTIPTPDALDMLVTSKNHDLKGERMRYAEPDDWLFALVSLQTQEGFLGAGNYGISRMNGGFSSRPALGLLPQGGAGARWQRDVSALLDARTEIANRFGMRAEGGIKLAWLPAWDGAKSLAFSALDPAYIEICRRVRLSMEGERLLARSTGTKVARINAASRKGVTGDVWTPVDDDKALTPGGEGFTYSLAAELTWGTKYRKTVAQVIRPEDGDSGLALVAQSVVRGQGKTEGYHERRIPLSKKGVRYLRSGRIDEPARIAAERVQAIATMRGSILRTALFALLEAGADRIDFDRRTAKQQIEPFLKTFERAEDARFFKDLNNEIEADDKRAERLLWLDGLARRAEDALTRAFSVGPQCGERRYRARSRALSFFHGALRSKKYFPPLAEHYRTLSAEKEGVS